MECNAASSDVHACAFFEVAIFAQPGGAPGNCAQHAARSVHTSPLEAAGAAPGGVPAAPPGGGHCAAQLWRTHVPTAMPACPHPAAISLGAHSVIELPSQTHLLKSGHAAPTVVIGSRQLVATQVLHASLTAEWMFPRHATMSDVDVPAPSGAGPVGRS
jgi:hypothetical protein